MSSKVTIFRVAILLIYAAVPSSTQQGLVDYEYIVNTVMQRISGELNELRSEITQLRSEVRALSGKGNSQKSGTNAKLDRSISIALSKITTNGIFSIYDKNLQDLISTLNKNTPEEVLIMAKGQYERKKYANAILLYYCSGKMQPDNKIGAYTDISARMFDIRKTVGNVTREKVNEDIVKKIVFLLMEELLQDIRSDQTAPISGKTVIQCWGYLHFAQCYSEFGDNIDYFNKAKAGIDVIENELGDNAKEYTVLGHCYFDAGMALANLGNPSVALIYFNKALTSYYSATDFSSEQQRQEMISQTNLMITTAKNLFKIS